MILTLPYEISPGIKNLYQIGGQLSITLYIHFITWDFLTHHLPLVLKVLLDWMALLACTRAAIGLRIIQ